MGIFLSCFYIYLYNVGTRLIYFRKKLLDIIIQVDIFQSGQLIWHKMLYNTDSYIIMARKNILLPKVFNLL